ncbi:FIST signal transduction protein [Mucilaginibacter flavus]|uniref:FIST signal transduction protein n=1 Tax=Mucilaginibacter flavus TaxID=931504 RepID=UPI0025B397DB|nr:FIST N-terminal domain-containing protein [Mucilaginibacter flavus]MDN3579833.1 FIST N-terminal domain-containing protein [Mucilaginibacter flavus]
MRIKQHHFIDNKWTERFADAEFDAQKCQLVLAFGAPVLITGPAIFEHLKSIYPAANIVFSSTSGEIIDSDFYDDSIVVTAIEFEKSTIACTATHVNKYAKSFEVGAYLMSQLDKKGLNCVFIISDGTFINGSDLVEGFNSDNPDNVPVTGGLAGDAARFNSTFTSLNEVPAQGNVIAIGFYGDDLMINHGSSGGWEEFGPQRTITKSDKNVLYEIDHKSALDLYKEYLGEYVKELPGSALLFPLSLSIQGSDKKLVRTILSVNEDEKSMTFAGNLPEGSNVRLMKANFDKLIKASSTAATDASGSLASTELAIMVSCVGRKLVLNERTDEELLAAKDIFGNDTVIAGFYSYGELSPLNKGSNCELHNQTMTITTFTEK